MIRIVRLVKTIRVVAWIFWSALALSGCAVMTETGGRIVTVEEWGGTPAIEALARKHAIAKITLHHQGETLREGRTTNEYLRDLQKWSRSSKQWLDIPYHYIIDSDGLIYEGRNIQYAGDTNTEYDPAGHALIEVMGNFEEAEPSRVQLEAIVALMTRLAARHRVPPEAIRGHRDYAAGTVCPGRNLYRYLENGYFRERVRSNLQQGR